MKKINTQIMFKEIKTAIDTQDKLLVGKIVNDILALNVIDNYYILKGHKMADEKSFFAFASMLTVGDNGTVNQKLIYQRVLNEVYNYDDDMGDVQAALDGMGNIQAYVDVAKSIF